MMPINFSYKVIKKTDESKEKDERIWVESVTVNATADTPVYERLVTGLNVSSIYCYTIQSFIGDEGSLPGSCKTVKTEFARESFQNCI